MKARIQKISVAVLVFTLAAAVSRLGAEIVTIHLPPETATYKDAQGVALANAQCLTCHSVEYVQMQPPLSLKVWTAEVTKMQQKYGAPVPTNMIPEIAYYLAVNYGTGAPAESPVTTAVPPPSEMSVEKMATIYGCLSCHKQDVKVVGPAYKDVRAKYLHDPDAIEKIMGQIRHGGTGKWGTAVMPPFTAVSDADAKRLAAWIMAGAQ
ncbi:MAG TPA: c-type cytochrome [Candidatus Acidoferrales bacterium]|nr:c-type cytochrome [Candidatus Acidoferrales bacterium]